MSEIRNNPNITTKELHSILSISVTAVAKNRAVIYARYSSDRQKEASIEQQTRECIPINIPANIQSPNAAKIWRSGIFSLCWYFILHSYGNKSKQY